jgi:predicted ATPase/DNA-binding SARP family transcriptional activator
VTSTHLGTFHRLDVIVVLASGARARYVWPVTMSGDPAMEIRVLGAVEAARGGVPLALGGPRQKALLGLLATHPGRPLASDRLVDELWAGEPPDGAEITLRTYVSRLRSALGDAAAIRAEAAGYSLDVDPDDIDATRFERLVRESEGSLTRRRTRDAAASLRAALALWRGRPFEGLADDGLLRAEAVRLGELRIHALELRMQADLELGASGALVDELEALVREHPYREAFWRQLMLALYRAERQADALAAYHRAREALDQQLGIEPGPELQALEAAILRQDVPVAAAPEDRHNLPAALTSFVGRATELSGIRTLIEQSRIVTLSGVGGVGKTRLAIEVARTLIGTFPDGVFFVDLSPIADPANVTGLIGAVLGIREQAGSDLIDGLVGNLRASELLLVLDNCEHLREACAQLAMRLLESCPGLRILATSREVLGVPGEVDHPVPPLALTKPADDLAGARESEAVQLFMARAREARPALRDDDATLETVGRICSDLDGLPLAIELAAARSRALSPAEIATRLRDRFQFLVSWRRLAPARHRTLREAMDWSYDLLGAEEQAMLRALSVFAGGFSLDAVAAVSNESDDGLAIELLQRLVEASLVMVEPHPESTRYRILETVRQYAGARLEEAGEADMVRGRHAAYFVSLAEEAATPLRANVDSQSFHRVAVEHDNIRAALATSRDAQHWTQALRIAEALWWFWWVRGELTEARAWLDLTIAHAAEADPDLVGRAEIGAAGIAWAQGDLQTAQRLAAAARARFADTGNSRYEGNALNTMGLAASGLGAVGEAQRYFEAALEKYRDPSIEPAMSDRLNAVVIDNLASLAHELHDDRRAIELYEEARQLNLRLGVDEGVAMTELHIGILESEQGHPERARELLARALQFYRRVGFLQYAEECLEAAAALANTIGSTHEAAFLLGAASRLREQSGHAPVAFLAELRERETAKVREHLGELAAEAALAVGYGTPSGAAMTRALAFLSR